MMGIKHEENNLHSRSLKELKLLKNEELSDRESPVKF